MIITVVVQLCPWFKFYFPLFLGMVIYDNEFKTRKIKFKPRIKLNHNITNLSCFKLVFPSIKVKILRFCLLTILVSL